MSTDLLDRLEWSVFDNWRIEEPRSEQVLSWNAIDELIIPYQKIIQGRAKKLELQIAKWNQILAEYGGDPTHIDWSKFRPLRLTREEDWSDWLAFLIQSSETGVFSSHLLSNSETDPRYFIRPEAVNREVAAGVYRADLIIKWINRDSTHLEVKVGDKNLSKMIPTAKIMQKELSSVGTNWSDFLLLLSDQVPIWESLVQGNPESSKIRVITWEDVSIALRRGITSGGENDLWRAWAYGFAGAIEQDLIGYSVHDDATTILASIDAKIWILTKGKEHE